MRSCLASRVNLGGNTKQKPADSGRVKRTVSIEGPFAGKYWANRDGPQAMLY